MQPRLHWWFDPCTLSLRDIYIYMFWQLHASTIATCPVLSINNGRESEGGDKEAFVSSFWFSSIVVGWRKLSRLSRLPRLCALVRELTEIDGQSSAGSHPWLEASSFHLSSYSSYTPVLFPFIFRASTQLMPPSSFLNHTWLLHYRLAGSKDSKAINSHLSEFSSRGNFFLRERNMWWDG